MHLCSSPALSGALRQYPVHLGLTAREGYQWGPEFVLHLSPLLGSNRVDRATPRICGLRNMVYR